MSEQRVIERLEDVALAGGPPVVLTIGTFDGVHRAHRELFREAVERARQLGGISAALTFRNHPRAVVAPDNCPPLLTTWEVKRDLILAQGVDVLVGLEFDAALAGTPAEAFVRETIAGRFAAAVGHERPGLSLRSPRRGEPRAAGAPQPRARLCIYPPGAGDARRREGEQHPRARGAGRGERGAGGRTDASAAPQPRRGRDGGTSLAAASASRRRTSGWSARNWCRRTVSYAVRAWLDHGVTWPAMMNIGWRPTVNGRDLRHEVHLIGFDGELTGKRLAVDYVDRLRDEKKFAGVEELTAQLTRDREAALALLGSGQ
jgi:riboflavin kinase/FMN adenylyltransferase